MSKLNKLLQKAVVEDAKNGIAKLRTLTIPNIAKTKKGEPIHKLPPAYKTIGEYEESFKKDYAELMKKNFLNKLGDILK